MKLGPVTKWQEKHGNFKNNDDEVMYANGGVIVFFPIYG